MTLKIIKQLKGRGRTSPDFSTFRGHERVALFVFDEFKRNGVYHNILGEDRQYLGTARSTVDNYVVKKFISDLPVLFKEHGPLYQRGYVDGEVFAVRPEVILEIDKVKCNGLIHKREKKFFCLRDQFSPLKIRENSNPYLECFVYMGDQDYFSDLQSTYENSYMINTSTYTRNRVYFYSLSTGEDKKDDLFSNRAWDNDDWREHMY